VNRLELNRRKFISSALAAGAVAVTDGAFGSLSGSLARAAELHGFTLEDKARYFPPVKVASNRLIRTVVGLRPFRPEGFVVEAERLGQKLLVHNYGHGGAGVTLSWGTASQAVELARDFIQTGVTHPLSFAPSPYPLPKGEGSQVVLTRAPHPLSLAPSPYPLPKGEVSQVVPTRAQRPQRARRLRGTIRFAVLGCGVSGLSTARLLQRRFQDTATTITIYAKNLPPDTTSNVAGAWWSPTSVYDRDRISTKFADQFQQACRVSHRAFQELVGPEYGVRWVDTLELLRNEDSLARELAGGNELYPQIEIHRNPKAYFGFPITRQFSSMLIEPHTYLRALLRDFYTAGGKVIVREFQSREEIARLREQIIFNCTGLGAKALFNDEQLTPVRGQLEFLLPQPEVDYCYLAGGAYMFPRRDGILLGGTWDRHDWSLEPNMEQTKWILEQHAAIMKGGERQAVQSSSFSLPLRKIRQTKV
jgi:glycine/D-amino acid oxidase-like deaminating enzyme